MIDWVAMSTASGQVQNGENVDGAVMSFGDHLEELRLRLILALLGVVPILILALAFSKPLLDAILKPALAALAAQGLPAQMLQTGPAETFLTTLKIAVIATILVGSPWLLYQAWLFVAPGLHSNEKRFVYILLPLSAGLTISAIAFLYKIMLPMVMAFFIGFGTSFTNNSVNTAPLPDGVVLPTVPVLKADPPKPDVGNMWINDSIRALRIAVSKSDDQVLVLGMPLTKSTGIVQQYRVSEYTSMFLSLALALSLGFQMPVVVLLLGWVGILDPVGLLRFRRHMLLISFILGAVLTPADPLSMIMVALPIYGLFEFGVLLHRLLPAERVARGFGSKHKASTQQAADAAEMPDRAQTSDKEPDDAGDA